MRNRTGIVVTAALVVAGFALLFLGGWMYQTSVANAQRVNANCGLNTCTTVEPSPSGMFLQIVGAGLVFAGIVVAMVVAISILADLAKHA